MSSSDAAETAALRLARVNLNLLVALDALLSEASVTQAAKKVGVTQSAMSHSLSQLRELFSDPLLVRSRGNTRLTATATALSGPLRRALYDVERLIGGAPAFDPAATERIFHIALGDSMAVALAPGLIHELERDAPKASLALRATDPRRMVAELEAGEVEIYIAPRAPDAAGLLQRRLLDEEFVCVARENHPALEKGLDLVTYVELPHVLVSPTGSGPGLVDRMLAQRGLARRVALRIPYFLAAPIIVAKTDLVLTLPRRYADLLAIPHRLAVYEPPFELTGFSMQMIWHERFDADPANVWLRELLSRVAAEA